MGGPTRLDPDSLWAGPPAWELEDLFLFLFFFRSGQAGLRVCVH